MLLSLMQWGNKYTADEEGPFLDKRHTDCGEPVRAVVECSQDHEPLSPAQITARPGASALIRKEFLPDA